MSRREMRSKREIRLYSIDCRSKGRILCYLGIMTCFAR